jgi:ABC-2 type transport system permease protein
MRTIFNIALNDLRILFRERGVWINLVIIPLALSYAVGFANGATNTSAPTAPNIVVDVINNDNSDLSAQFLQNVREANTSLRLCPADNDAEDVCQLGEAAFDPTLAEERLKDQVSLALLEIPAGFGEAIVNGETAQIVYRSSEDATAPTFILQAVQAAAQKLGGALVAERVGLSVAENYDALTFRDEADRATFAQTIREDAEARWSQNPVTINYTVNEFDAEAQVARSGGGFSQSVPGMASMYVMITIFPVIAAFIIERKQWTIQRLATMPISRAQILAGKMLARFAMGMISYSIIFGFGLLVGARYGADPLAVILLMVTFTLAITGLALALTAFLKNETQAQGITLLLSLTLAPLGGAWWPLEIVPAWMRTVAQISPVYWVMDGYRDLAFYGGSLATVLPSILVLLGMTVVFFAFGVSRFRYQ